MKLIYFIRTFTLYRLSGNSYQESRTGRNTQHCWLRTTTPDTGSSSSSRTVPRVGSSTAIACIEAGRERWTGRLSLSSRCTGMECVQSYVHVYVLASSPGSLLCMCASDYLWTPVRIFNGSKVITRNHYMEQSLGTRLYTYHIRYCSIYKHHRCVVHWSTQSSLSYN